MDYDFVEIGTSDFDTLIQSCADTDIGLSIDPIQYYLDRLPEKPHVKKITAAISESDGHIHCYHVPDTKIQAHGLPWWVRGCNSIGAPHRTVMNLLVERSIDPATAIETFLIPMMSFATLVREHNIRSIKYLKIDTEGHDCVILSNYIDVVQRGLIPPAQRLLFESNVLTPRPVIDATIERLLGLGYTLITTAGDDTIMEYLAAP
jgi:hypothetical protein